MPAGETSFDHLVLTYVPQDPARSSWFGAWDPAAPGGLLAYDSPDQDLGELVDLELVLPTGARAERTIVKALRLEVGEAIDVLAPLQLSGAQDESVQAWAVATRLALGLIGRGLVLPWVSPQGWDTWRVDPLESDDLRRLAELGRAMPARAHCVSSGSAGRGARSRIVAPTYAIRHLFDAVADALVRSPAAARACEAPLFSESAPVRVLHLRPWVTDVAARRCVVSGLVLRIHPPSDVAQTWKVELELRSRQDPSLIVKVADLWSNSGEVLGLLGPNAELEFLAGLKVASGVCPTLERALHVSEPAVLSIDEEELDDLLDHLEELGASGVEIRWPSDLLTPKLSRRVVVSASAPAGSLVSVGDLDSLLSVDWELLLDDVPLTVAELEVLSKAKLSVIALRGQWVRLGASDRRLLEGAPPPLSASQALTAALGSGLVMASESGDGASEVVEVELIGAAMDFAERIIALSGDREAPEPAGFTAELRPYQRRGLAWMLDLCDIGLGGCLADDMGLGKTVQLLAVHAQRGGRTLVVCPTSLVTNWQREAQRFVPGVAVRRHHGPARSLGNVAEGELIITTYGVLRSDVDELASVDWDLVVADEAQHAKNPRSRTAKALRSIPSRARLALTGTPVENRLTELWAILDWAVPGLLGPLETFRRETAIPIERDGDEDALERLTRLVRPFLLRRRKEDPGIAPELPPKTEFDVIVSLSAEQVTLYRAVTDEVLDQVAASTGISRRGLVLKLLTELKQITNHPAHFLDESGPLAGRSGKLDALEELLAQAVESGQSTLVFSQYVAMGKLLEGHLLSRGHEVGLLHGGLSMAARQDLVDRFQGGELAVLLLSLKAGGTGLNLTRATQVVHYDRWWNPAVEDQATDRAYRIGQDRPVSVHRLITEGTVEDRVAELLAGKRALADKVVGSGEGWIGNLDDDELDGLVRLAR